MTNLQERKIQLENLIASLQNELEHVNNEISKTVITEVAEAVEVPQQEEIVLTIEEKETAKGITYIHTVKQGSVSETRKSKNQYDFAYIAVNSKGEFKGVHGYRTSLQSAENEASKWNAYYKKENSTVRVKVIAVK